MSPGAKKGESVLGNVYLQREEKIVDGKIKRYFENNASVAENRRCRVETEAITSTVNPQLNLSALCLPGSQLAY